MSRTIPITIYLLYSFLSISAQPGKYRPFYLSGKVDGLNEGTIYLEYSSDLVRQIYDSSVVKNGYFFFKGQVKEPTDARISLTGPFAVYYGNNYFSHGSVIFLEPGKMTLRVKKDNFRDLQMKGSVSQKDNERLNNLKKDGWLRADELFNKTQTLRAVRKSPGHIPSVALNKKIDSLEKELSLTEGRLFHIDSLFIVNNPTSYVTAYLVNMNLQFENILFYPVDDLYNKMPNAVKNTNNGKSVLETIDKIKTTPVGGTAHDFWGTDLQGNKISLSSYKGKKYVLLDFWGSWCTPCRAMSPYLRAVYGLYQHKGLEIIGIAQNDTEDKWRQAVSEDSTGQWRHIRDDSSIAISNFYSANALPVFFLIDKEGKIMRRYSVVRRYGEKPFYELYHDLKKIFDAQN